jgi:2-oxoglutarate ferredoxin oxidoreductase subunit alpha
MDHSDLSVLIVTNAESALLHKDELHADATVFVDAPHADALKELGARVVALPMTAAVKAHNAPHAAAPAVGVGAFCFVAGLSREESIAMLAKVFGDVHDAEMNVTLALAGFDAAKNSGLSPKDALRAGGARAHSGALLEGNKAVGLGFLSAGLEYYVGYPMTPSSSILHFLAKEATKNDRTLTVIHPEDEISVINMALGVSYAGKRVAIGTATGGFALMNEAFSFAGVSEIPLAIAVSSRQGPATGAATRTSQGDLRFVLSSGHGEFPRVVIAPGDPEEAYVAAQTALNLAWGYQLPTIVLLDKQLSESYQTSIIPEGEMRIVSHKPQAEGEYHRFQLTDDGISPLAFPGTPNAKVKATSYEHDEFGIAADQPEVVRAMQDKRWKKMEGIIREAKEKETVKVYGDPTAKDAIIFFGSTKGALLEAVTMIKTPLRLVQVLWMEPFPADAVVAALLGAERLVSVEANHNAQFAGLLREKTGINTTERIVKYDARPFDPALLAHELRTKLSLS